MVFFNQFSFKFELTSLNGSSFCPD